MAPRPIVGRSGAHAHVRSLPLGAVRRRDYGARTSFKDLPHAQSSTAPDRPRRPRRSHRGDGRLLRRAQSTARGRPGAHHRTGRCAETETERTGGFSRSTRQRTRRSRGDTRGDRCALRPQRCPFRTPRPGLPRALRPLDRKRRPPRRLRRPGRSPDRRRTDTTTHRRRIFRGRRDGIRFAGRCCPCE